jgi:hypothetical protein
MQDSACCPPPACREAGLTAGVQFAHIEWARPTGYELAARILRSDIVGRDNPAG